MGKCVASIAVLFSAWVDGSPDPTTLVKDWSEVCNRRIAGSSLKTCAGFKCRRELRMPEHKPRSKFKQWWALSFSDPATCGLNDLWHHASAEGDSGRQSPRQSCKWSSFIARQTQSGRVLYCIDQLSWKLKTWKCALWRLSPPPHPHPTLTLRLIPVLPRLPPTWIYAIQSFRTRWPVSI